MEWTTDNYQLSTDDWPLLAWLRLSTLGQVYMPTRHQNTPKELAVFNKNAKDCVHNWETAI